jgi:hypothetical protein
VWLIKLILNKCAIKENYNGATKEIVKEADDRKNRNQTIRRKIKLIHGEREME